jgi:hypothetical protein
MALIASVKDPTRFFALKAQLKVVKKAAIILKTLYKKSITQKKVN